MSLIFGNDPAVRIELEPGIYLLPEESSVGKTYMCSIFRSLASIDRVTSHTFPDDMDSKRVLDNSLRDVVALDRYDMCTGDYTDDMQRFAEKGILLVDAKAHSFNLRCRSCRMYMTRDELVIK